MNGRRGFSLVELLVVVAIMSLIGTIIYPFFISFQFQSLSEISKSDLGDRANRLLDYLAEEVRESGFLLTSVPRYGDGSALKIRYDDNVLPFSHSILVGEVVGGNDTLEVLKAASFFPKMFVNEVDTSGDSPVVTINRSPVTGSGIEINDNGGGITVVVRERNNIIFEGHKKAYLVHDIKRADPFSDRDGDGRKDKDLTLWPDLAEPVPVGSELLGVRALRFYIDDEGLRYDDYVTSWVLDKYVDGLQVEYFMADGSYSDAPSGSAIENIRGIRIYLLVRAPKLERGYVNAKTYALGNRTYGPYDDGFRRVAVERLVEVKNYALE